MWYTYRITFGSFEVMDEAFTKESDALAYRDNLRASDPVGNYYNVYGLKTLVDYAYEHGLEDGRDMGYER